MFENNIKRGYFDGTLYVEYQINSKGQKDGWYRSYYHNGQVRIECTYKKGLLDGIYK
jgi:antitoxin component YwqK of YwqJK toxin-antitoxin module